MSNLNNATYNKEYKSDAKVEMHGEISEKDYNKDSTNVRLTYQSGKNWLVKYFLYLSNALDAVQKLTKRSSKFQVDGMSKNYYSYSSIMYMAGKSRGGKHKVLGSTSH